MQRVHATERALALRRQRIAVDHEARAREPRLCLQAVLVVLLDEPHGVGARIEVERRGRADAANVGEVRAEIIVAERRVDLLRHLAAFLDKACLELLHRVAAAGEVGRRGDRFLRDVVVEPFAHRRVDRLCRDRAAEQVGDAGVREISDARAAAQVERLALADVVHARQRHVARLDAGDDVAVVALDQLLQLLQSDLRIDLVVLADDLDLAPAEHAAVRLDVHRHRLQVRVAECCEHLRERVQHADLERCARLGEDRRCTTERCGAGQRERPGEHATAAGVERGCGVTAHAHRDPPVGSSGGDRFAFN